MHKHKPRCYDSLRDLSSIRGIVPTWLPLHKRQEFQTLVFCFICRDISEKLLFTSAILVAPVFDNLYKVPTGLSFHFKTKVIKGISLFLNLMIQRITSLNLLEFIFSNKFNQTINFFKLFLVSFNFI